MKRVLITGKDSYIGTHFRDYLKQFPDYYVEELDVRDDSWKDFDFSKFDVVYHVAGLAHADVGNVTDEIKDKYYKVNKELAVEIAKKCKELKVKQFVFMSSMIVYSGCKEKMINKNTIPHASNFYGDSKLQADLLIQKLSDVDYNVCIIRPPMIYGKGSKGNYPILAKLAKKMPIFPIVNNQRSMLYIDNLCQFIKLMIDNQESGIYFPQNKEYTNTSDMVKMIADEKKHKIVMIPGTNRFVKLITKVPGKIGDLANKAFGDSAYDMSLSDYDKGEYRIYSLKESIHVTEGE